MISNPFKTTSNLTVYSLIAGIEQKGTIKSIRPFYDTYDYISLPLSEIATNTNSKVYFLLTGGSLMSYEATAVNIQGRDAAGIPMFLYVNAGTGVATAFSNVVAIANKIISTFTWVSVNTRLCLTGFRIEIN
jgi:hypothetical protein